MKVFIVFLAFVLILTSVMVYETDLNRYMNLQKRLKCLAEDCAEAGALLCPEYAELASDEVSSKALDAAKMYLEESRLFPSGSVEIVDYSYSSDGPSFGITLEFTCDDIFRLPFIEVSKIRRFSVYEWR